MNLTLDTRVSNFNKDIAYDHVSIEKAKELFSMLDGSKHTLLVCERGDGSVLSVGGGASNFIVTLFKEDVNFTLKNLKSIIKADVELCVGGQFAEFANSNVVSKVDAINSISNFFANKEDLLSWDIE